MFEIYNRSRGFVLVSVASLAFHASGNVLRAAEIALPISKDSWDFGFLWLFLLEFSILVRMF